MSECDRAWLEHVDAMRYEAPGEALSLLLPQMSRVRPHLHPLFFGVCGSTYRILAGQSERVEPLLEQARQQILFGQWIAKKRSDPLALADLYQRYMYVELDSGALERALVCAERAAAIYDRNGNRPGRGKALVDQGLCLYYLGKPQEAITSTETALRLLPESERRNRFSAYQILGLCCLEVGEHQAAMEYTRFAERLVPSRSFEGKLRWLQARISLKLLDLDSAENYFLAAADIFFDLHLGEAALASCELARVQLLQGRLDDAWKSATLVRKLVVPLAPYPAVAAALADLLRGGRAALTLALVNDVKRQIEEARERREWRSLRNLS
ncbi:MAG: tetratricopeptide repeat protein [bacterium]|nr:tetratricopeptide repeat protein [bacterium]